MTLFLLYLYSLLLLRGLRPWASAQICDTTTCTTGCETWDSVTISCNYDWQVYDSKMSCFCKRFGDLSGNVQALEQCVACDQDRLSSINNLVTYQVWLVICATYATKGEPAAQQVGSSAVSDVVSLYSTSFLPQVETLVCRASGLTSSTATTSAVVVSSSTRSLAGSTPTLSQSGVSSTAAASVLTPNSAASTSNPATASSTSVTASASSGVSSVTSSSSPSRSSRSSLNRVTLFLLGLVGIVRV